MDAKHTLESAVASEMFKGSDKPEGFPHRCPFNPLGLDRQQCIVMSGSNVKRNRETCFGADRNGYMFPACNSEARRCVVCLEIGRRGAQARAVTNPEKGTCDEHVAGVHVEPKPPAGYGIRPVKPKVPFSERHRDRVIPVPAVKTLSPTAVRSAPQKPIAPILPTPPAPKPHGAHQEVPRNGAFKSASEAERIVLHGIAYGYDFEVLETKLREKGITETLASIVRKLYRDFDIPSELTEWAARRRLGKMYLDELERVRDASPEPVQDSVVNPPESSPIARAPIVKTERNATMDVDAFRVSAALVRVSRLTRRQREILASFRSFERDEDVANALGLAVTSLKSMLSDLCQRLGISDIRQGVKRRTLVAIAKALSEGASHDVIAAPEVQNDQTASDEGLSEDTSAIPTETEEVTTIQVKPDVFDMLRGHIESGAATSARPSVIGHAQVDICAQRFHLLPKQMRDVVASVAQGLENGEIAKQLRIKYSTVSQALSTTYLLFELTAVDDRDDKRAALMAIYRRAQQSGSESSPVQATERIASADRERLEYLESLFSTILDLAEAALKRIGGKRRGN